MSGVVIQRGEDTERHREVGHVDMKVETERWVYKARKAKDCRDLTRI